MTDVRMLIDPIDGNVALFDVIGGSGAPNDRSSPGNEPILTPGSYLDRLYFHTELDNLEVAFDSTVAVVHASQAGASGGTFVVDNGVLLYKASSTDRLLLTHGLGYIPDCLIAVGNNVLFPGMPVQAFADGRGRYCTAYATTTEIRLYEWTSVSGTALPTVTLNYEVLVFRQQRAAAGNVNFKMNPTTGICEMGRGRFQNDRRYLQVVPGGSPLGLPYGKTIDLKNGAPRFVNPDGTIFEPVAATRKMKLVSGSTAFGSSMAYNGTFAGPTQILVQAP